MRMDMHNDFIERPHLRFNNSRLRASEERGDVVERIGSRSEYGTL